jgi:hypothetical protein
VRFFTLSLRHFSVYVVSLACIFAAPHLASAAAGTTGASFLEIPVGAGPAALGAAYTALAQDAYAPTINPGGLGFLDSTQISGQHLSYLESLHYEYLSVAVPLPRSANCSSVNDCPGSAFGASIQYLGSGSFTGRDQYGTPTGDFSSYYAAYNLSYGRSFTENWSLGLTGKVIQSKLDDVSGSAYAADLGTLFRPRGNLALAATLMNVGSRLKYLSESDALPMAVRFGAAYRPTSNWLVTSDVDAPFKSPASFHVGGEWRPIEMVSLRTGFRTDTLKGLSLLAGYSIGVGLNFWGQEFSYAWLPYGDLGNTHYLSLLLKFGEAEKSRRNLIQYQHIRKHRSASNPTSPDQELAPDFLQLMELLQGSDDRIAKE